MLLILGSNGGLALDRGSGSGSGGDTWFNRRMGEVALPAGMGDRVGDICAIGASSCRK